MIYGSVYAYMLMNDLSFLKFCLQKSGTMEVVTKFVILL